MMTANRSIVFEKNKFYHIYNRGHNKQQIFFDPKDYDRFYQNIARFRLVCPSIQIISWCFLPNHFHFLMIDKSLDKSSDTYPEDTYPKTEQISIFMQKLQQAYAAFFNTKYGESIKEGKKGPVFEGRFKAKLVEDEDYLLQIKQYIEWNAVKHEIVDKPEDWEYTSFIPGAADVETEVGLEFNPYFE